ncbi:hypothetical protein [Mucilaginibacter sp.]|uniref:hypothetical protein n=1 Tax=Mucilaginibacter sp. TaxID=1882438 RepID=UPI003B0078C4
MADKFLFPVLCQAFSVSGYYSATPTDKSQSSNLQMDHNAFKSIINAINNFCAASEPQMAEIASFFRWCISKKDEFFLKEGQERKNIGFFKYRFDQALLCY